MALKVSGFDGKTVRQITLLDAEQTGVGVRLPLPVHADGAGGAINYAIGALRIEFTDGSALTIADEHGAVTARG